MTIVRPPVAVTALGPLVTTARTWRLRGERRVTVVGKVTLAIVPGASVSLVAPEPLRDAEDESPSGALRARETWPLCGWGGVTASGESSPPPRPWTEVALVVGRGASQVLVKQGRERGPLATSLGPRPERARLPAELCAARGDGELELPPSVDARAFQAAPPDQQVLLHGDEWIALRGLHPVHVDLAFGLPGVVASVRFVARGGGDLPVTASPLRLDAVHVDVAALRAHLVFRAHWPLGGADGVEAVVRLGGSGLRPELALAAVEPSLAAAAPGSTPSARGGASLAATHALDLSTLRAARSGAALPFGGPTTAPPAPAGGGSAPAARDGELEGTSGTRALSREELALAMRALATPTPFSGARSSRPAPAEDGARSAPIAGAPWSGLEAAAPLPAERASLGGTIHLGPDLADRQTIERAAEEEREATRRRVEADRAAHAREQEAREREALREHEARERAARDRLERAREEREAQERAEQAELDLRRAEAARVERDAAERREGAAALRGRLYGRFGRSR